MLRKLSVRCAAFFLLFALCLTAFVPVPARAASSLRNGIAAGTVDSAGFPGICYAENGEADTRILFPPEDGSLLFGIGEGDWTGEGPVQSLISENYENNEISTGGSAGHGLVRSRSRSGHKG